MCSRLFGGRWLKKESQSVERDSCCQSVNVLNTKCVLRFETHFFHNTILKDSLMSDVPAYHLSDFDSTQSLLSRPSLVMYDSYPTITALPRLSTPIISNHLLPHLCQTNSGISTSLLSSSLFPLQFLMPFKNMPVTSNLLHLCL